jgi:hypothetical protein
MERFRLIRGDAILGVVTRTPEDRIDGGAPWEVGRLESAPEFEAVRDLFAQEQQLLDEVVRIEMGAGAGGLNGEPARLLEQAAGLQRKIMEPGVRLVHLLSGEPTEVDELHVHGTTVYWR